MKLVETRAELKHNLDYLESDDAYGSKDHQDRIELGMCFVAYDGKAGLSFAPSRFVGYADNSFASHYANRHKDGRETNPAISSVLGFEPEPDDELEKAYQAFCVKLGVDWRERANFGKVRKFWDARGALS